MTDILDDLKRYKSDAMRSQDAGRQLVYTRAIDEIERMHIRERELLHWLQQVQLKAEFAKQRAIVARDAADHAIQYAIDAETAAIAAISSGNHTK